MPTFAIEIREKNERRDGKFPVAIRITHRRVSKRITTDVHVTRKQIMPDFSGIKDTTVLKSLLNDISNYETILSKGLGTDLSKYTTRDLVEYIEKQRSTAGGAGIDFINYSWQYLGQMKDKLSKGYIDRFKPVIRNLIDFFGRDVIYIKEINVMNLNKFAEYMQTTRTITRVNQLGNRYEQTFAPVKSQTVKDYIGSIQTIFNAAVDEYNGEDGDLAIITHNPFPKVKIEVNDEPQKRDLSVEDVRKIFATEQLPGLRMQRARDVLVLSFYFAAANMADLFGEEIDLIDGVIDYQRQKTRTRRKDKAQFSLTAPTESMPLIAKYRDSSKKRLFTFYKMYVDHKSFCNNIDKGCKQLAKYHNIHADLASYYFRHSWSTFAAEDLGYSDNDIALALNHVCDVNDFRNRQSLKITRGYIHRRKDRVDRINRDVINFVLYDKMPERP